MSEGKQKVRPADGKLQGRKYDPQIKRRARLMWCLLNQDKPVEDKLGLPNGTLTVWRQRNQPDGMDWHEFREELDIAERDGDFSIAGPQSEIELRQQHITWARKLASVAMASLDAGQLYDEDGNKVKYLYNSEGKKVDVCPIRPASLGQVTQAVDSMAKVIDMELGRLGGLGAGQDEMRVAIGQVMEIFWNTVVETIDLTDTERRNLDKALQQAGKRAGQMALPGDREE